MVSTCNCYIKKHLYIHWVGGGRRRHLPEDEWTNCQNQKYMKICACSTKTLLILLIRCTGSRSARALCNANSPRGLLSGYELVWDVMVALLLLGRSCKGAEAPDWVASLVLPSISGCKNSQATMRGSMWEADLWVKSAMCFPHSHLIRTSLNVDEQTCNYFKSNCKDNRMSFWGLWYIQW